MNIGNLSLQHNVLLAPMAGVTDVPFRALLRDFGCNLAFTEMISAAGLVKKSPKTFAYLASSALDRPLGVQIFGADPAILAEGARIAAGSGADLIDINMGCSVKKVTKTGAGAALLKDPQRVARILEAVRRAVSLPLTIKIRSGWNSRDINAREIAAIAEACGADAVAVHPRTAEQGFSGKADWSIIAGVKSRVVIPVIGNGDVARADDAVRLLQTTGCDGVMVARGTLGNPWIFWEITARLQGIALPPPPSLAKRELVIARHLGMMVDYYGEEHGSRIFRKHLLWYTKGLPGGAIFRKKAGSLLGKNDMLRELHRFLFCGEEVK